MADISIIVDVKEKGVTQAVKNTKTLENNVKLLSKSMQSQSLSQRQYYNGLSQLAKEYGKSEKELRKYATGVRKLEAESKKAKAAAKAEADAVKEYARARRQATEEDKRRDAVIKSNIAALNQQRVAYQTNTKELTRIRMATDSVFAAEQKLLNLKKLLRAEVANGNMTMREAAKVQMDYKQSLVTSAEGMRVVGKRANRAGVLAQQAGYQFGDFAVQVQSGANPMMAFGQQATQLIGTFSMLAKSTKAIMAFSALGVIVPVATAIAGAFMRVREEARDAAGAVDLVKDAVKELDENIPQLAAQLTALQLGFGSVEEAARTMLLADYTKQIIELENTLSNLGPRSTPGGRAGGGVDPRVAAAERELKALKELVAEQEKAIAQDKLRQASAKAAADLVGDQPQEAENVASATRKAATEAFNMADAIGEAATNMLRMAGINVSSGVDTAAVAARELAKGMFDSVDAALAMINIANGMKQQSGPRREGSRTIQQTTSNVSGSLGEAYRRSLKIGEFAPSGGGGGSREPEESALEKLQKELDLMEELYGKSEEYLFVRNKLGDSYDTVGQKAIDSLEAQYAAIQQVKEADEQRAALANSIATTMGDGLTSIVDGTKSVKDAFKDMASAVIKQLWDVYVVQKIVGEAGVGGSGGSGLGGLIGKIFGSFDGGGYTGSGPRSGGMDGKGGFMAMLHPQETVVDHTKGQSTGGGNVTIHQNFNFSANGDESVKRIIAQEAPQIAKMTKSSILSDRRRGGQTKSVFG